MKVILSCEHASNALPQQFSFIKNEKDGVWESHRAYDPGAYSLYQSLSKFADFSYNFEFSRLLIEPNRSLHHRLLFSEYSNSLSAVQKKILIDHYYLKYRNTVENCIQKLIVKGEKVLHLSIHSFTPVLQEIPRNTDIGILYDPSHSHEKEFAGLLKKSLQYETELKIRFNYPYLGRADGFTTYLRKKIGNHYMGIELEMNQKFAQHNRFPLTLNESIEKAVAIAVKELKISIVI